MSGRRLRLLTGHVIGRVWADRVGRAAGGRAGRSAEPGAGRAWVRGVLTWLGIVAMEVLIARALGRDFFIGLLLSRLLYYSFVYYYRDHFIVCVVSFILC